MSKGSGKTQTQTVVEKADTAPWAASQPFLMDIMQKGMNYSNTLPSTLVSPFSPQTEQGLGLTELRALRGSPVMNAGRSLGADTLSGAYVNPDSNPYLPYYMQRGMERIAPSINATFSAGGRTGSEAHSTALGRAAGDFAGQLYGGAYDAERGRQMQTLALAPTIASQDYADINALLGVGQTVEGRAQRLMDMPYTQLQRYAGLLGNGFGSTSSGTSSSSQPIYSNPMTGALGGGLAGAGLAQALNFNPLYGAIGGGLLGLFG